MGCICRRRLRAGTQALKIREETTLRGKRKGDVGSREARTGETSADGNACGCRNEQDCGRPVSIRECGCRNPRREPGGGHIRSAEGDFRPMIDFSVVRNYDRLRPNPRSSHKLIRHQAATPPADTLPSRGMERAAARILTLSRQRPAALPKYAALTASLPSSDSPVPSRVILPVSNTYP